MIHCQVEHGRLDDMIAFTKAKLIRLKWFFVVDRKSTFDIVWFIEKLFNYGLSIVHHWKEKKILFLLINFLSKDGLLTKHTRWLNTGKVGWNDCDVSPLNKWYRSLNKGQQNKILRCKHFLCVDTMIFLTINM